MTIQEAIRSGKPFFRSAWLKGQTFASQEERDWAQDMYEGFNGDNTRELNAITIEDILAEDWEVKP